MARDRVETHKVFEGQARNWHMVSSPSFSWPEQEPDSARIKGWENRLYLFSERNVKVSCRRKGDREGQRIGAMIAMNNTNTYMAKCIEGVIKEMDMI